MTEGTRFRIMSHVGVPSRIRAGRPHCEQGNIIMASFDVGVERRKITPVGLVKLIHTQHPLESG